MAGCFDHMRLNLDFLEAGERRNIAASVIAGALFFTGWWILIDASAKYPSQAQFLHSYHVCGVIGTLALFMVNSISNGQVLGDNYNTGCMGQRAAKAWLFLGFLLSFASIIAATWILFGAYVIPQKSPIWPGVAIFLQNIAIFGSCLVFKFMRSEDHWG